MKIRYAVSVIFLLMCMQANGQGAVKQTADVGGQGGAGPPVAVGGGTIIRTKNGVSISISMPTPTPMSYNYPPGTIMGSPEAFTGWAFVFNDPAMCTPPMCDSDDLGPSAAARGGVYNIAGHISGRGNLQMVGHISSGQAQFGGAAPLDNPAGAEIHVAIAPHGMLDPSIMPTQIKTPIGNPGFWWTTFFFPPGP